MKLHIELIAVGSVYITLTNSILDLYYEELYSYWMAASVRRSNNLDIANNESPQSEAMMMAGDSPKPNILLLT
jgi:hypothetical protein